MKISLAARRLAASALFAAGLAYPVCAAVCPKGIGGCPSPGRCFLFVDADANALCDYTGRSGSQTASRTPAAAQAAATPVPDATVSAPAGQAVSGPDAATAEGSRTTPGGILESLHLSIPLAEILFFLLLTGTFFALFRTGALGIRPRETRPAVALAAFFGLPLSLILTCLLAGDTGAGTSYALVYMAGGTPLAAYLWYIGEMDRAIATAAAVAGSLAGFVFLAPLMPTEIGGIVNVLTGVSALNAGVLVIAGVLLATLVAGRTFCGAVCPVGSLQELAYCVPTQKFTVRRTEILEIARLAVFLAAIISAVYLVDLLAFTGLYDLFSLTISAGFVVALGILAVSVFLYRPVCRILCPFGTLFALLAAFSIFRMRRTEACIGCRKCEKACPAAVAGPGAGKRECYLCARCTEACPVKAGMAYRR